MSLLNQVLRDLDRRQAPQAPVALGGASPTLRPPLVNPRQRLLRWAAGGALTTAAIVVGGWAQGSIAWPARSPDMVATVAPPSTPIAQPVALPAAPAPVSVAAAPPPAPVALAPTTAPAQPTRVAIAPMTLPAPVARPARLTPPRPAIAAPVAASPASAAAHNEPHIDKHAPTRTAQERAEAQYQRGVTAHQAGQIDESAAAFAAALREEPRFAPARLAQAGVLIGQSRQDEALALLQEGIALTPAQPQLALMLARLQAERQDLAAAIDTLAAAAPNATHNAEYQGLQAAILQRAGRHAEAVEKFSAALRLAPGQSVWWMGLGISLAATGQVAVAREAFMRAKTTGQLPPEATLYVDAQLRQIG